MDKKENLSKSLEKHLPGTKKTDMVSYKDKKDIKDDYELARTTYKDLIQTGMRSLDVLAELARESEHPRAFEVLSRAIKDVGDTTDKLMELQKNKKALNKEEEEILKQIEQELMKDDPGLAKTVEDSTLSKFTRNRAVISFFVFVLGLLTMFSTYIIQPAIAIFGFSVMAVAGYVFVANTRSLLKAENVKEWNIKQVIKILRNQDSSRQK